MIIRLQQFLFLALSAICSCAQQLLSYVRTERAAVYELEEQNEALRQELLVLKKTNEDLREAMRTLMQTNAEQQSLLRELTSGRNIVSGSAGLERITNSETFGLLALDSQSHSVPAQSFLFVNSSISMPKEAVRPFQRPLRDGTTVVDVAVALWIPGGGASAVWGRAWEENGATRALFIYRNTVKILDRGFRLLTYSGNPDTNGFKFSWMRVKDVDHGTILFSGANMHAAAVFSEDGQFEYLGDADWQKRRMEFVKYDSSEPHTVANYGGKQYFDDDVYVLTKQRCNCQC